MGGLVEKGLERFDTNYVVEARYLFQVWELDVPPALQEIQQSLPTSITWSTHFTGFTSGSLRSSI